MHQNNTYCSQLRLWRKYGATKLIFHYYIKSLVLRVLCCLLFLPLVCEANTITATAGTKEALEEAIGRAVAGDTVIIPAGDFEFNGTLYITKGINLIGSGIDKTILRRKIVDESKPSSEVSDIMIDFRVYTQRFRVSGISIIGYSVHPTALDTGIRVRNSRDFRIDHCRFKDIGAAGITIYDSFPLPGSPPSDTFPYSRGVIDHSEFIDCFKPRVDNYGYGVGIAHGDIQFESALMGSEEAVFIEDCYFSGERHATASSRAARYVIRHSHIVNNKNNHHAVDQHGIGYGVGGQWIEVYNNIIEEPSPLTPGVFNSGVMLRGGAGVIHNNTFHDYGAYSIVFRPEGGSVDERNPQYPVPGLMHDVYVWGNTIDGNGVVPYVESRFNFWIQNGREYFLQSKAGYSTFAYPHPLVIEDSIRPASPAALKIQN